MIGEVFDLSHHQFPVVDFAEVIMLDVHGDWLACVPWRSL